MTSTSDFHLISWQNGLGLGGSECSSFLETALLAHFRRSCSVVVLAVLIPVLLRKYYSKDLSEAAEDPAGPDAPRHSYDPLISARASLALDDDARRSFSSSDGSARLPSRYRDGSGRHDDALGQGDDDTNAIDTARPTLKEGAGSAAKVSRLLGVQVK